MDKFESADQTDTVIAKTYCSHVLGGLVFRVFYVVFLELGHIKELMARSLCDV